MKKPYINPVAHFRLPVGKPVEGVCKEILITGRPGHLVVEPEEISVPGYNRVNSLFARTGISENSAW